MSTKDNTLVYSGWKGGEAVAVLDVCFEVKGADGKHVRFFANRKFLAAAAPSLAALFVSSDEKIATVTITDVDPVTFRCLLFGVVHGGDVGEEKLMAYSIIDAAEKYGVTHLLDEFFVRSNQFTMDNVMGALLFANAHNLAGLNKLAVDFIQGNKEKFRKVKLSSSWKCDNCPETFGSFNDLTIHEISCKSSQEGNGLPAPLVATGDANASVPLAAAAALIPSFTFGVTSSTTSHPVPAVGAPAPNSAYGGAPAPAKSGFGEPAPASAIAPVPVPASAHGAAPAPAARGAPASSLRFTFG